MEEPYFRSCTKDPSPHHPNPQAFHERTTSIFIAIPFIVCFSLFGVFNLVGGTVLTAMSCKPKLSPKAIASLQRLVKDFKLDEHIDPMKVVGIMLLVTGSLLVVIGLALGVTACRSVSEQERRKRRRQQLTSSSIPMLSMVERTRTSSFASGSRGKNNGKKRSLEKTVSPILEASEECESVDGDRLAVEIHHISNSSVAPSLSAEVIFHTSVSTDEVRGSSDKIFQTELSQRTVFQKEKLLECVSQTPKKIVPPISGTTGKHNLAKCDRLSVEIHHVPSCSVTKNVLVELSSHKTISTDEVSDDLQRELPQNDSFQKDVCNTTMPNEKNLLSDLSLESIPISDSFYDKNLQTEIPDRGIQTSNSKDKVQLITYTVSQSDSLEDESI